MNWMKKWAGAFPVFVAQAKGAHFTDVDGREYVRFVPGRYGRDDGPFAGRLWRKRLQACARRHHHADVADGRFVVGRRRIEAAIWIAVLA